MATLQIMVAEKTYQGLTTDQRKIVEEEAVRAWHKQRDDGKASNEEGRGPTCRKGCELTSVDGAAFQRLWRPLWEEWGKKKLGWRRPSRQFKRSEPCLVSQSYGGVPAAAAAALPE